MNALDKSKRENLFQWEVHKNNYRMLHKTIMCYVHGLSLYTLFSLINLCYMFSIYEFVNACESKHIFEK